MIIKIKEKKEKLQTKFCVSVKFCSPIMVKKDKEAETLKMNTTSKNR